MSKANIFLLLPETNPTTNWSKSNEPFQSEQGVQNFVTNKVSEINSMELENYQGYFDNMNLINFFEHYDILEEFYPPKPKRLLLNKIKDWSNWRNTQYQKEKHTYKILGQEIESHSLSEIAQRKEASSDDTFALLNNYALSISNETITVNISSHRNIQIDNVKNSNELKIWFSKNRVPPRSFHAIPKHGENRQDTRIIKNEIISPLRCSAQRAQELLNTAIGFSIEELFQYDSDYKEIIVFKYENNSKQNLYHGFHVPISSPQIPDEIRNKLNH